MIEIMIDLQGGAKAPLYEKIYDYIKKDIIHGKIHEGEKLPSTRLLAKHLSVSRSTVEMSYEQLLAEGYIKAEPCRGFFVCDVTELYQLDQERQDFKDSQKPKITNEYRCIAQEEEYDRDYIDFSPYAIDTECFPYNVWRKINKNVLLDDREELLLAGNGQGDYGLRRAIADYLHQARGVNCEPENIIIGAGNEYLEILLTQVLGDKKCVLTENPTYMRAYHTFSNMGYQVVPVLAGEHGMEIGQVRQKNPDIVYMMPSHQFPLGTVMPLKQRLEFLKWASEDKNRYLIEDDHDSEYRYRGKPIPSLQSIDHFGKVIYLGTFSKSIAPSLRISYMVLPEELLAQYHQKCGFFSTTVPKIQQEVLREFIEGGHFERHLNKMRGIYRAKHDYLLGELKQRKWVHEIRGDHAGLHVLVSVETSLTEQQVCHKAFKMGVKISGISEHYIQTDGFEFPRQEPVLLIGYGKLKEAEIKNGLEILDEILKV